MRLTADVKPFISQMAKAEAAAKRLRDGLGDSWEPFEKETQKQKQRAPRQAEEVAGAFAKSFSRSLESAFRSLPKATITTDSTDAQVKLSALRQAMQDLADRRIGVDINAASALGELRALQMELERLGTSAEIDVRADAGAALAQLQSVQREVDRLGGETARVEVEADTAAAQAQLRAVGSEASKLSGRSALIRINADGGRALMTIAAVAAAVASLPAVATITIGVGVMGGGLAALGLGAAGFAAVAAPSIGRVTEALKETESAAGGAGGAMKSAAQKAAESAASALSMAQAQDRVRDAAHGVRMAQRGVGDALRDVKDRQDALRQAQESAGLAAERVSLVAEAGARRVADAERTAADAHRATQRALEDLTRARERAQERLEDLALATEGGALSEERAQISIRRAQADLARVNAPGSNASALDKEDAELRVREAEFALKRLKEGNADLAAEAAKANREGVEGSEEVLRAKEAVEAATRREADAERAVSDARTQAARDVAAAQREARQASDAVARAQRDVSDALRDVADAQRAVSQAERDQLRAKQQLRLEQLQQAAAMEQAGAAAGGAATKMSKLNAAERALAKDIKTFQDDYLAWQRALQPDVFPVIRSGLDLMTTGMKIGTPLIRASAGAFGDFIDKVNEDLQSEQWSSFFFDLTTQAPRAIEGLGTAAGNVAGGLAGVIQAFLPYTDNLMDFLEKATQGFEDWGQNLKGSPEFEAFISYIKENGPKVGEVLSNIAIFAGKIVGVGAGMAPGLLDFLVGLSEKLAAMNPAQVEAIAKGVAAIFAAANLGATLKLGGLVLLAEVLGKMSPGQIEAAALAIGGLIVAVKGYQAVSAAAGVWSSLAGGIDKAGDAATRNKGKLAGLGELGGAAAGALAVTTGLGMLDNQLNGLDTKLGAMSSELTTFAQTGQLSGKLAEQWGDSLGSVVTDVSSWDEALGRASGTSESFRAAISRLANPGPLESFKSSYLGLMNTVTLGSTEFDKSAEQIGFMDQELANLVSSGRAGEAEQAFARLTKEAQAMGVPVSALRDVFPQYSQAMTTAGAASNEAAGGIDAAKQKVDGLQQSLDTFAGRTDALQAIRNMETAYRDAAAAVEASSGKLDFNAQMTDKQRDAVILAREAFGGYLEKVATGATAQEKLSGRTGDATIKVAEQLPRLMELAGKSAEAREQVYQLAEKFGLSRQMADKAALGSKAFKDELDKLKDKQVKIELDTKKALDQAYAFAKQLLGIKLELPIGIKAPAAPRAYGGIYDSAGRQYMASGGIRSVGSSPAAMIASSPYMISGRAGPDVVFGEAGMEAYIPLSTGMRDRGLQILQEAAGIMGMAVVPQKVALNGSSSITSSSAGGSASGAGAAMVTVTGIEALRSTLDTTAMDLTGSLGGAVSTLDAALGDAGTLTSSLTGVGEIAGHLAGEVTGWGEVIASEVPPLTDAVAQLGDAISAAASGDAKGNAGSKGDDRNPRGSGAAAKKTKAEPPKKIAIQGASSGTTGVALSGSTNWSRQSRPVQAPPSTSGGSSSSSGGGGGGELALGASQQLAGSLVHVGTLAVTEKADVDQVAAALYSRLGSKGK